MSVNTEEPSYTEKLMTKVADLKELCDVVLISGIDKQRFPAHRLILIASSKYFETFLGSKFRQGAEEEIVFKDINANTLKAILTYIYFGRIEITANNVSEIFEAALSMELVGLGRSCGEFWAANFAIENCVKIFLTADKYQLNDLWSRALNFICDRFEAVPIDDIQEIDAKNFQEILKNDRVTAAETVVFDRLARWIDKKKAEGGEVDSGLLKSIRLEHIPTAFLVETIEPLCKQYECLDSIVDEYRKRLGQSQAIALHRNATDVHQPLLESRCDNVDINYQEYVFADSNELGMELTVGNCVEIFLNADKYQLNNLRVKALHFICDRFETVPIGDIQQINEKNFQEILKNDQIPAAETIIFDRLVQWMDRNRTGAVTVASDMLKLIRLDHIPIECLIERIEPFFDKFGCGKMVMNEYRKRSKSYKVICDRYNLSGIYCFLFGPYQNVITIRKYDSDENKWNELGSIRTDENRAGLGAVLLNGELYVMGGENGGGYYVNSVVSYKLGDLSGTTWPMPNVRCNFKPICIGKYIYALGGGDPASPGNPCERFDCENGLWQSRKSMPIALSDFAAIEFNGLIYVAGRGTSVVFLCYNHDNDSWSQKTAVSLPIKYTSSLAKTAQFIYAIDYSWTVHQYEANQDIWTTMGNFGIFGTIADTISHYNQIYIMCTDGTFVVLKTGASFTITRLTSMLPHYNYIKLFSH